MAMALDILEEIGQTYGPTRKLHHALANLVAATIVNLERSRNGPNIHSVSFGSPATPSLVPPPIHVPMRIDPNLRFDSLKIARPPTVNRLGDVLRSNLTPYENSTIPPISWQDPVNGQAILPSDSQTYPPNAARKRLDPGRISPAAEGFEDSMFWEPSLEWAGGWDDFLDAIAM
jgi:hypothetical protein